MLPGPVLLNQSATLLFSSDFSSAGSGFVVRHRAIQGRSEPAGKQNVQYMPVKTEINTLICTDHIQPICYIQEMDTLHIVFMLSSSAVSVNCGSHSNLGVVLADVP